VEPQTIQHRGREHIQNVVVQANQIWLAKDQVEILERLGQPEALHAVCLTWLDLGHVVDGRICNVGFGGVLNAFEHLPSDILICLVTCDAVEDEDGFNGLRSTACQLSACLSGSIFRLPEDIPPVANVRKTWG
jgi:hypothetical protein